MSTNEKEFLDNFSLVIRSASKLENIVTKQISKEENKILEEKKAKYKRALIDVSYDNNMRSAFLEIQEASKRIVKNREEKKN